MKASDYRSTWITSEWPNFSARESQTGAPSFHKSSPQSGVLLENATRRVRDEVMSHAYLGMDTPSDSEMRDLPQWTPVFMQSMTHTNTQVEFPEPYGTSAGRSWPDAAWTFPSKDNSARRAALVSPRSQCEAAESRDLSTLSDLPR